MPDPGLADEGVRSAGDRRCNRGCQVDSGRSPKRVITRRLRLRSDAFGRELLSEIAAGMGVTLDETVARACQMFLDGIAADSVLRAAPSFKPHGPFRRTVRVSLPEPSWAELDAEARRQGIALESLVEHAVLVLSAAMPGGGGGAS